MKERIKVPLLGGNESLGSCNKLFEALTKWQWKLSSPLIVCVGHENNWEWLKVPSSRAKFLSRKLIQLSVYVVFSKSLFFFFSYNWILVLTNGHTALEIHFVSLISACSTVMMLGKWCILVFWILSGVTDMFYFLIWLPHISANFIIQSFHVFSPLFLSPTISLEK